MQERDAIAKLLAVLRGDEDPRFAPMLLEEYEAQIAEGHDAVVEVAKTMTAAGVEEDTILDFITTVQRCGQCATAMALIEAAFAQVQPQGAA